ncbi:MAG: hypothetical protein KME23_01735 [Goleter apudmare HA4340-LM2]|jgi:uncharacterized caspase-like protein|nr:hypothetical protein [Goleter apudmare HA4340-LM2]
MSSLIEMLLPWGVITFYSCTANQKSWEIDELQHGSFTHSLLEGLRVQGEANSWLYIASPLPSSRARESIL